MKIDKGLVPRILRILTLGITVGCSNSFAVEPRSYFNLLWSHPDSSFVDARYTDMGWFRAHSIHLPGRVKEAQPPGYSILQINYIYNDPLVASDTLGQTAQFEATLRSYGYDWSRIVAVVIDEPYWTALANWQSDASRPCGSDSNDPRTVPFLQTTRYLENAATAVRNVSNSKTLFWVNYSEPEMTWMKGETDFTTLGEIIRFVSCGSIRLNREYINIVSMDKYNSSFNSGVKPYYDYLLSHRATLSQKIALVPGMFYSPTGENGAPVSPATSALWQNEYFIYADSVNGQCLFNAEKAAISGAPSPCPLWAVTGWMAESGPVASVGAAWLFMFESSATPILNEWRRHVGVTARTRAALQPVLGMFH